LLYKKKSIDKITRFQSGSGKRKKGYVIGKNDFIIHINDNVNIPKRNIKKKSTRKLNIKDIFSKAK